MDLACLVVGDAFQSEGTGVFRVFLETALPAGVEPVLTIATVVVAFWWVWPHFKGDVPAGLRRWAMMALAIVCLLPQILIEVFYARPFDVTAYSESVDYEFTSREHAIEFALWNADAAWVKVDGMALPKSEDNSD